MRPRGPAGLCEAADEQGRAQGTHKRHGVRRGRPPGQQDEALLAGVRHAAPGVTRAGGRGSAHGARKGERLGGRG
jgi:hypothetical protein